MEFKDYYKTLGVTKEATGEEIQKKFRKLAREHHPDVAKDKAKAEERFKEINEAYEVLKDPEKRRNYDELGQGWQGGMGGRGGGFQPPPGWSQRSGGGGNPFEDVEVGGTGFSDFFERFFGSGFAGRGGGRGGWEEQEVSRGRDLEIDFLVTPEQAIHGGKRQITLRRAGSAETETYQVRIPEGVYEGQRIRLAGRGGISHTGGPRGDLFLRVKFQQHPDFFIRGADLNRSVMVEPWDAVLGTEVQVTTLDGKAKLKVAAGTSSGKRFRLPGYGMPKEGGGRGDLYVEVEIAIPTKLTDKERELWEELAKASKG